MKHLNAISTGALLALAIMLAPISAGAITYGTLDCSNSNDVSTCGHPYVVMLAGLRSDNQGTWGHCSATLIGREQSHYLFLTAGHCTALWDANINGGWLSTVGVSFLAVVPAGANGRDPNAFAAGGIPVTHPDYGPRNSYGPKSDYGVVSVPASNVEAKFSWASSIDLASLAFDIPLDLKQLKASVTNPQKNLRFHAVGYGLTELLNTGTGGDGSNAGGGTDTDFGKRRVADSQTFSNLRKTILQTSQNPAVDNNGTCGGDSGGPEFYVMNNLPVQVGITSAGDSQCRATGTYARTDIASAEDFVDCARGYPSNVKQCGT